MSTMHFAVSVSCALVLSVNFAGCLMDVGAPAIRLKHAFVRDWTQKEPSCNHQVVHSKLGKEGTTRRIRLQGNLNASLVRMPVECLMGCGCQKEHVWQFWFVFWICKRFDPFLFTRLRCRKTSTTVISQLSKIT